MSVTFESAHKFNQANPPPMNEFQLNHLLQLRDSSPIRKTMLNENPKNNPLHPARTAPSETFCLGRVVGIHGSRICVEKCGTDKGHNQWLLCDSINIRPYANNDSRLDFQPPRAYSYDASRYICFVNRLLSKYPLAPIECFKLPPQGPNRNQFIPGDRLEAVDMRNPAFICPASVRFVDGNYVCVTFDGWGDKLDFWARFDSRDLFPAGWCTATNNYLEEPGTQSSLGTATGLKVPAKRSKSAGSKNPVTSTQTTSAQSMELDMSSEPNSMEQENTPPATCGWHREQEMNCPTAHSQTLKSSVPPDATVGNIPTTSMPTISFARPFSLQAHLPANPTDWSITEVYDYLVNRDGSFQSIADLLKLHEVDGISLLLLTVKNMTQHLHIKLGPALKLKKVILELGQFASPILPSLTVARD